MDRLKRLFQRGSQFVKEHRFIVVMSAALLLLVGAIEFNGINTPIAVPGYGDLEFHNGGLLDAAYSRGAALWNNPTVIVTRRNYRLAPAQAIACYGADGQWQFRSNDPTNPESVWVQVK